MMLLSPVNLEHYNLVRVDIEPIDSCQPEEGAVYPDFGGAAFTAKIDIAEVTGENVPNPPAYQIALTLECVPKSEQSFPYKFKLGIVGFFSYRGQETGEKRKQTVSVSGCGMLYSTLRDVLHSLALRFSNGPIMLPTVSFMDIRQDHQPATEAPAPQPETPRKGRKKAV